MILNDQNIMFFLRAPQHGGTENVVLQLCEVLHPLVNKIIVVSADGFAKERLKPFGIKHYCIPDIEKKTPYIVLSVCREIREIVRKEKITVIHTHHRMAAFYVRLLGLDKRCVFINTSHNTFTNNRILTRYAYKKGHLVACGEMVKNNLQDVFGLKDITVIHNAVKPFCDKINIDKQLDRAKKEGKYLIGNIGRLSKQKGMEYYIQAIPIVKKTHPEAQFYIVGDGEDANDLKELAKTINASVVFMGYRTDIQNLMSQFDIIVLSSLWEGLPLTPIEAFSVGKTIVATKVDGTPEIVKHGVNGRLIAPRDSEKLAEEICWMIEHPKEKKEMEKNAIETFNEEFSFDTLAQAYIDYYRRL